MIPVVRFISRPVGFEIKVPPGVTIVGVTVDKSFTQYEVAGYLNWGSFLKSLIVKVNDAVPGQIPDEVYSIVYVSVAEILVSISPVTESILNPEGLDVNVPPEIEIVGVTSPSVPWQYIFLG